MKEAWKDIEGHDGKYQVSNTGRIRSNVSGIVMKLQPNRCGYVGVNVKRKNIWAHRAVAKSFLPNPNNHPCVCHKDDDKKNNNVDNLFWGTYKMNTDDMISKGRQRYTGCGEDAYNVKLNEKQVRVIKHIRSIPNHIKADIVAKIFRVSAATIKSIWYGNNWGHVKI